MRAPPRLEDSRHDARPTDRPRARPLVRRWTEPDAGSRVPRRPRSGGTHAAAAARATHHEVCRDANHRTSCRDRRGHPACRRCRLGRVRHGPQRTGRRQHAHVNAKLQRATERIRRGRRSDSPVAGPAAPVPRAPTGHRPPGRRRGLEYRSQYQRPVRLGNRRDRSTGRVDDDRHGLPQRRRRSGAHDDWGRYGMWCPRGRALPVSAVARGLLSHDRARHGRVRCPARGPAWRMAPLRLPQPGQLVPRAPRGGRLLLAVLRSSRPRRRRVGTVLRRADLRGADRLGQRG
jgi:hypothetical protein